MCIGWFRNLFLNSKNDWCNSKAFAQNDLSICPMCIFLANGNSPICAGFFPERFFFNFCTNPHPMRLSGKGHQSFKEGVCEAFHGCLESCDVCQNGQYCRERLPKWPLILGYAQWSVNSTNCSQPNRYICMGNSLATLTTHPGTPQSFVCVAFPMLFQFGSFVAQRFNHPE